MKQGGIHNQLVEEAQNDSNILGFLVFGSVATGTHREDSDIDVIKVLRTSRPSSGIRNTMIDGVKVGDIFFTYEVLVHSVKIVPYLLHPLGDAKLLLDREGMINHLLERIRDYFAENAWSFHRSAASQARSRHQ